MSLNLRSGKPVWMMRKPRIERHPTVSENIRGEVVVIGGGISGALMAHRLVNLGMDVTLIDARKIGAGSTAASTAILSYEADVNLGELIKKIGKRDAVRAYQAGVEAIGEIGRLTKKLDDRCDFRKRRSLYLASSEEDVKLLQREFEVRRRNGFEVEMVGREELWERFGLNAEGAILNKVAAEVNPVKLTLALVRAGEKKGVRVFVHTFVHTRVVSYRREGEESILVTERGNEVRARHVVFATGYESQQFLRQKGVHLKSTYAIASRPTRLEQKDEFPVIWETARPYLYVRATTDGRVIAGGEDVNFVNEEKRDKLLKKKARALEEKVRRLLPELRWRRATAWTGTFAETDDGLPFIGQHPEFPGAHFALGYGGNGITFSMMASGIVGDLLRGRKNRDAHIFRFGRSSIKM
jgi:glycine/D-amino acid oxidase-like deaminating enzyme